MQGKSHMRIRCQEGKRLLIKKIAIKKFQQKIQDQKEKIYFIPSYPNLPFGSLGQPFWSFGHSYESF